MWQILGKYVRQAANKLVRSLNGIVKWENNNLQTLKNMRLNTCVGGTIKNMDNSWYEESFPDSHKFKYQTMDNTDNLLKT